MSERKFIYFLYQKDFSEKGKDRYFISDNGLLSEVSSADIVGHSDFIVTHDYWLITPSLFKKHKQLPPNVIDINLLSSILLGRKASLGDVQPWDISKTIKPLYIDQNDFDRYISMYYRRNELDIDTYKLFASKLEEYAIKSFEESIKANEADRFYQLELPLFNLLSRVSSKGIRISEEKLHTHKDKIKYNYYTNLKAFAEKHDTFYFQPSEGEIKDKLRSLNYDVDNYEINFLIDFMPSVDGYTDDLRSLEKLHDSYRTFNCISRGTKRIKPIVETHATSTSRIYYKSPNLQNISKKYRDIFIPDDTCVFSYVDYDQFEVGIMAALSGDEKMNSIYTNMDAYADLSIKIFGSEEGRKKAKIIFLSYTYGMKIKNILSSVERLGGSVKNTKLYFSEFQTFEKWKEQIVGQFERDGEISTVCGNNLKRISPNELTQKEKRSVVSHVVQGTGSYIFKSALLALGTKQDVDILIPMHDAVLIQHSPVYDPKDAVDIFEETMTNILDGKVKGKASIEPFFSDT